MIESWASGFVATSTVLGEPTPEVPKELEAEVAKLCADEKVTRARAAAEVVARVLRDIERTEAAWRW